MHKPKIRIRSVSLTCPSCHSVIKGYDVHLWQDGRNEKQMQLEATFVVDGSELLHLNVDIEECEWPDPLIATPPEQREEV